MRSQHRLLLAFSFALFHLLQQPPAAAQTGAATFGEAIEVRVVNVEAVVVDGEGLPVHGLAKSDFRLLVDGKEVPIDHFDEVIAEIAPAAAPAPASSGDAAAASAATPAARRFLWGASELTF